MTAPTTVTTAPSGHVLPRWAYLALALVCVCMGLWASYITLQYFEHGAKALETDKALQGLAVAASVMFVASEMGAFALAALLTERQLKARRWSLTGFAGAVLLLEVFTIVAVQLALTVGADLTQTTLTDTVADLQKQIATAEANAKTYTATAESLRAADQLKKAAAQTDKATAESAKASQLYGRLEEARKQKRPTMTGLLGEKTAIAYAVARGVLVSLGGLVFFGVAGALLRAARGGTLSVDHQLLELLHELRGTPGQLADLRNLASSAAPSPAQAPALAAPAPAPAPAPAVAPAAPAPAAAPFTLPATPMPAPAPAGVPTGLNYSGMAALAGAGALASLAAPMAHSAPAVPAAGGVSKPVHADVSKPIHAQDVQQGSADAPKAAPAVQETALAGVSETIHAGVSESVHADVSKPIHAQDVQQGSADAPKAAPAAQETALADVSETIHADVSKPIQQKTLKPRVKRAVSAKLDTGTDGKAGARYKRIKAGVLAGKIRPSVRGIQAVEGGSQEVVADYLQQLENEGVTVRHGRGWALAKKGGTA